MSALTQMFEGKGLLALLIEGSLIAQLILLILLLMSSLSWAVILLKWLQLRKITRENLDFLKIYQTEHRLDEIYNILDQFEFSSFSYLYKRVYEEVVSTKKRVNKDGDSLSITREMLAHIKDRLQRELQQGFHKQSEFFESRLSLLATISSSAPFIGLFGTVLGIIDSFQNIGTTGVTSLAAVAPGISEALIATAAGLLAAIPALIAYNYYRSSTRKLGTEIRNFSLDLTNKMEWIIHEQFHVSGG